MRSHFLYVYYLGEKDKVRKAAIESQNSVCTSQYLVHAKL